jgi:hypothetical protein
MSTEVIDEGGCVASDEKEVEADDMDEVEEEQHRQRENDDENDDDDDDDDDDEHGTDLFEEEEASVEDEDESSSSDSLSSSTQLSPLTGGGKGMGNGSLSSSSLSSTASTESTSSTLSSSSSSSSASSPSSSPLSLMRKHVSFGPNDVKECLHRLDMTREERHASWYTVDDFQRLKSDRRALVKLMNQFELIETKDGGVVAASAAASASASGLESSPPKQQGEQQQQQQQQQQHNNFPQIDDSIRGLELRTKEGKRKRHLEIQSVVRAVLNEQSKALSGIKSPTIRCFQQTQCGDDDDTSNGRSCWSVSGESDDAEVSMAVLCGMYTRHNIEAAHKRGLSDQRDVMSDIMSATAEETDTTLSSSLASLSLQFSSSNDDDYFIQR